MQDKAVASLTLFGSPRFSRPDGSPLTGRAVQRHRIGLLALLASAYPRGRAREAVMAMLWPDHDTVSARKLLNQSVYVLRRTLGDDAIVSDFDELRLDTAFLTIDVVEFRTAIAQGEDERAASLYSGAFLDAFFVTGAPDFGDWADRERDRLAGMYAKALERLAEAAEAAGDRAAAADWWRARVAHDPADSGATIRLMLALDALGNRAGALTQARLHEQLLRDEFGTEPVPELMALADRLRSTPRPVAADSATLATPLEPAINEAAAASPGRTTASGAYISSQPRRSRSTLRLALAAVAVVTTGVVIAVVAHRSAVSRATEADDALRGTRSIAAYEHYLRGSDSALLRSDSGVHAGIEHLQSSVALDPDYALAWAGLGKMYGRAATSAPRQERDRYFTLGLQAAERALALDDRLADAHATLGILLMGTFDFVSAEAHLNSALALDPDHANTHEWLVTLHLWMSRPHQALVHAQRALELEPLSPRANAELARALAGNDRCPEAIEQLRKLESVRPPLLRVSSIAALCHARLEQWDNAIAILRAAPPDASGSSTSLIGFILGRAGRQSEALEIREQLLERWQRGEADAYDVALQFVGSDQLDESYVWLNRALQDRSLSGLPGGVPHTQVLNPLFAYAQDDPRFADLQKRLGGVPSQRTR